MEQAIEKGFTLKIEALTLGVILCIMQALDGILTTIGVSRFGLEVEANPLIRGLMESYGEIFALALVKSLSIVAICVLVFLAHRVSWISKAMGYVAALYLFVAILPWTYLLFFKQII